MFHKLTRSALLTSAAAILAMAFTACNGMIYDTEGNCTYYVRFVYDYNLKWADAFPSEVTAVTLYVIDPSTGNVVWKGSESGEALAREGYLMEVPIEPGTYDLLAWAGDTELGSFHIPSSTQKSSLTATLQREMEADGTCHYYTEMDRLYHGLSEQVVFSTDYEDVHTVELIKDTNDLHVVLQHLSGDEIDPDAFHFMVVDANGTIDWDNTLIPDDEITYHAWYQRGAASDISSFISKTQTEVSGVVAELTLPRLMTDHADDCRLVITRKHDSETVVDIPLIQALLLVKGYYRQGISDQEYLDRGDDYSLTFFIDDTDRWIDAYIYINSWRVVLSDHTL